MCGAPERTPERDAALAAMLPFVPRHGWGWPALRAALSEQGQPPMDAELLFPGGTADLLEAFIDAADRDMTRLAAAPEFAELRTTGRVRALVLGRLAGLRAHREAVRRAAGVLALPRHAGLAARTLARTVDEIWHLAGDTSADFSWYTKRALLAGVYSATLLYWLGDASEGDASEGDAATAEFLDRRLAGVGRIGKLRGRVERVVGRMRPAA